MRTAAVVVVISLLSCAVDAARAQDRRPTTMAGRSTVYAPHGVVATSQPLASAVGVRILEDGGNAVDAAVAAAAVLSLVEPHMTGIGGDMFAIVWIAEEGRLIGLNASGASGALMTRDTLAALGYEEVPLTGAEPITVPGALGGWSALLERYGTRELADVLGPAIGLAEEGFPVSPIIARGWAAEVEKLREDVGARATFLIEGERAPRPGEWFRNPDLAATYRAIADGGAEVLYGGELGRRIVERVQELGGFLTLGDLSAYAPTWVDPISADFRGYRVWELPPNGQGIAALQMLKILEPFDLVGMGHNSATYLHHLIEAKKLAFADLERHVGDPDAMTIDASRLLEPEYIESRRALIDPTQVMERPEPGGLATASETIYLSAADSAGNMVSFINSIYWEFGSGVVVPGTGFALQNRGAGFTMEPGLPNTVAPARRPFHTIIPGFVSRITDEGAEPWLSFGVMGGSMQPQGHVQLLLNLVVFGMDIQEAIDAPRFRHLSGLEVALESPISGAVRGALSALGHEIADEAAVAFGGAQAVMRLERGWAAGSDPRKDGAAVGH